MNWDDVRYFLAVCREGSVSKAGKKLAVNHTTVARRITAFEDKLGSRLFDRTRDGYVMTQAAENIFDKAREMEDYAQAIDRAVVGRDAELRGSLRLTVPYDFANTIIAPQLPRFRREYPAIDLELLTTTDRLDLGARAADIAVRLTSKPPEYLVGREVLPLRHGVYATQGYLRRMGEQPDVVLFRGDTDMPEWVTQHFPGARVALRTDNLTTVLSAVAAGVGLARMPCFEADSDRRLRRLDLKLTPSTWGIWILNHVDLRSTARVRVCREFLIDIIESQRSLILGEESRYAASFHSGGN
ncbi:MAG: LysR family transcriptional regulator [Woeseiaceae bacterium]|nr:LysR family transcriptional regulator [Woeseiaceae bacterium]